MQDYLQRQIEYKDLLLTTLQQITTSFDLTRTMPGIVSAAQQASGAEAVRLVIQQEDESLALGAGQYAEALAVHDAAILTRAQESASLTRTIKRHETGFPAIAFPVQEITVWPLKGDHTQAYGCLWLASAHPLPLTDDLRAFMTALAAHATRAVEHARAFQHAQDGRKWLATILASSADPIMVVNSEARVSLLNHAAEALLQLNNSSVINRPVGQVLQAYPALLDLFQKHDSLPEDAEWESADGRVFSPRFSPVDSGTGETQGYVLTLRDVTPFKLLNRNQEEFIHLVSHDLRSPLTFMRGFADLIGMVGELNDQQAGFLEKIQSGIHQITTLVDNIQDAGRWDPQTGFYEMNREPADLTRTLLDIVSNHQNHAEKNGIQFVTDIAPDIPIVNVDNLMIERALINLIVNAIKYSPDGGQVTASMRVVDNQLVICIQDTGLGIAQEYLTQLFERGTRIVTEEVKKNRIKGSGLGLFIVRSVAQRHNGTVRVESKPGAGSKFYFSIPLKGANLIGSH
ncbi:MAG: GAF domain-containing protein [Anaerolineae bacterium]|nr:GAF domain-containing protein [Anaerolineae bacterium]